MSRVATNYSIPRYNNGTGGQSKTSSLNHSSNTMSNKNNIGNNGGLGVNVRSAAPAPIHKETVHACPICNGEYKDPRVLPCTHTYCLNCIRDKLINNNQFTCPKCQQQVDDIELNDLPRNVILSQQWRMNVQPITSVPTPKKPVTYQSISSTPPPPIQMPNQQDKRKSSTAESNGHDSTTSGSKSHGIASLINVLSRSSGTSGKTSTRSSRSSSMSNAQPIVSNLVRIYSEATSTRPQEKPRSESVMSTGKNDELVRIFQQATNRPQQQQQQIIKRPSQAREEAYEEMTWDTLVHGTVPVAPPFPNQWHKATENLHYPPEAPERPISVTGSDRSSQHVDHLRDIIASINQQSHQQTPTSFPQGQILLPQSHSRPSTASRSHTDFDDEDDDYNNNQIPIQPPAYASVQPRQNSRADSIQSSTSSSSTIRQSPAPPIINTYQQRSTIASTPQQKQEQQQQRQRQQSDKMSSHSSSITSPSSRSSERSPLQIIQTIDFAGDDIIKPQSPSVASIRSLASDDANDQIPPNQNKLSSTERFTTAVHIPSPLAQTNNSSRAHSQIHSGLSTPTRRSTSRSMERDTHYIFPTPPLATPVAVSSRVDLLLSDQKRLEREIDEQIKRLKYDYDDIRKQIHHKESSIHNEVKNLAGNLDENITEHYNRQQKAYADLAADTNIIGNELERLKSLTNTNNNKPQLWDNLEKIEFNIRNIRRALEQQKQSRNALKFSEGHRAIAADTIGQVNYNQIESHRRFHSPQPQPPPLPPTPPSFQIEQTTTNIVPYKYIKIDHLSTLEPETMAITENNKKILLGICNKLFILNEHGDMLKTIPLTPSIRGLTISKKYQLQNIAYISHDESISMIDIDSGQTLDCVKETDSSGQSGTFLPLGIDTDNIRGDVYVCDYRNSCVIKFDDKLEFITQWRIYNHSDQYDEARPKLISVYGQKLYMIIEHSCKPFYNQGIAYTFSLHICDANTGNIIKIIDADLLATQRLRWPCSVQAISNEKCYILDTMTSGKYFNGQWQKHWSRVLEIEQDGNNIVTELFQLDSEAATMAMTKQIMIIAANGDILFVDLGFLSKKQQQQQQQQITYDPNYQNLP
ncbi:unnamed protein product [Rotaria sordida]|uniref:RING-type domain-containing protein n=1 Tax=Rotaria sordida TaxID=392033 RepID=A0A818X2B6_9BILA|nr:unnamed protein product [Rotaria sordida]CAF3734446.1 unnamed protein product [Rotaria sordida]